MKNEWIGPTALPKCTSPYTTLLNRTGAICCLTLMITLIFLAQIHTMMMSMPSPLGFWESYEDDEVRHQSSLAFLKVSTTECPSLHRHNPLSTRLFEAKNFESKCFVESKS